MVASSLIKSGHSTRLKWTQPRDFVERDMVEAIVVDAVVKKIR
jgi:hypothetical protein